MVKYKTKSVRYSVYPIEPVEVERETEKFVIIGGRRNAKASDYESYFDTWDQAHRHMTDRAQSIFDGARNGLASAQRNLNAVLEMEPERPAGQSGCNPAPEAI